MGLSNGTFPNGPIAPEQIEVLRSLPLNHSQRFISSSPVRDLPKDWYRKTAWIDYSAPKHDQSMFLYELSGLGRHVLAAYEAGYKQAVEDNS